ncbi:MAG: hypothetical protein MK101_09590 [Phycisphaerales bacterium]|nr:hypothetical protein [Phycisphaerales bacterium]
MTCVGRVDLDYNEFTLDEPWGSQLAAIYNLIHGAATSGLIDEELPYDQAHADAPFSMLGQTWLEHLQDCNVNLEEVDTDDGPSHCQRLVYIHVDSDADGEALTAALESQREALEAALLELAGEPK